MEYLVPKYLMILLDCPWIDFKIFIVEYQSVLREKILQIVFSVVLKVLDLFSFFFLVGWFV